MSKSRQSRERYQRRRQQPQFAPAASEPVSRFDVACLNCTATPTVGDTALCEACCFADEDETSDQEW